MKEMGVPLTYVETMFAVPKKRLAWIRRDDFERDFEGFIPQLQNLAGIKCDRHGTAEQKASSEPTFNALSEERTAERSGDAALDKDRLVACERALQVELASRAHVEAPAIREGKRP